MSKKYTDFAEFINLPKRGRVKGVYMIGNIYIGASIHVLNRLKAHVSSYLSGRYNELNNDVLEYFKKCESYNIKVKFRLIDDNPFNEQFYTSFYKINTHNNARFYHSYRNR